MWCCHVLLIRIHKCCIFSLENFLNLFLQEFLRASPRREYGPLGLACCTKKMLANHKGSTLCLISYSKNLKRDSWKPCLALAKGLAMKSVLPCSLLLKSWGANLVVAGAKRGHSRSVWVMVWFCYAFGALNCSNLGGIRGQHHDGQSLG